MHQQNTPGFPLSCRKHTSYSVRVSKWWMKCIKQLFLSCVWNLLVVQHMCIYRLHNIWSTCLCTVDRSPSQRWCLKTQSPVSLGHYLSFSMESPIKIYHAKPDPARQITMLYTKKKKCNVTLKRYAQTGWELDKNYSEPISVYCSNNWCYCILSGFPHTLKNNEAQNQINEIHALWCNGKMYYRFIRLVMLFVHLWTACPQDLPIFILGVEFEIVSYIMIWLCIDTNYFASSVSRCMWDNLLLRMSCGAVP